MYDADETADYEGRIGWVVEAMLQSPHFLYRPEVSNGHQGVVALSAHELATRLSFLIWASGPDEALLSRADSGALLEPAVLAEEVDRMLLDPRAQEVALRFYLQWLGIDRLTEQAKNVSGNFSRAEHLGWMQTEAERFLAAAVWEEDLDLSRLLTAPFSFVNRGLAAYYGTGEGGLAEGSPVPASDAFERVVLDERHRLGILGLGAFLTGHSGVTESTPATPVKRGAFIRSDLLCAPAPPPPDSIDTSIADPGPADTNRMVLEARTAQPDCAGCHSVLNPAGFPFEHFDSVGRYRSEENGYAIDASGELRSVDELVLQGPLEGLPEMARKLAESDTVRACVNTHWFRYLAGRAHGDDDGCALAAMTEAAAAGRGSMRDGYRVLTAHPSFFHARFEEEE